MGLSFSVDKCAKDTRFVMTAFIFQPASQFTECATVLGKFWGEMQPLT